MESDLSQRLFPAFRRDFYPRSPCGERLYRRTLTYLYKSFLSTLSVWRATTYRKGYSRLSEEISIHALRVESDPPAPGPGAGPAISIHALRVESDPAGCAASCRWPRFLSTLSVWRATLSQRLFPAFRRDFYPRSPCGERPHRRPGLHRAGMDFYPRSPCGERPGTAGCRWWPGYFYPRSPCGERRVQPQVDNVIFAISIHALRVESDGVLVHVHRKKLGISIHALRVESDICPCAQMMTDLYFYPRSPCGERPFANLLAALVGAISIHALRVESDPMQHRRSESLPVFLSTLSVWRATTRCPSSQRRCTYFYPRSPCGERQQI